MAHISDGSTCSTSSIALGSWTCERAFDGKDVITPSEDYTWAVDLYLTTDAWIQVNFPVVFYLSEAKLMQRPWSSEQFKDITIYFMHGVTVSVSNTHILDK